MPSGNKWNYIEGVLPLLETEKMTLHGITKLDCRDTHEIRRLKLIDDPEEAKKAQNDDLCRIFGELENKTASYTRSWLGFFITVHHRFFAGRASMYLKSKELKLDEWMESVKQGCRGDTLALYGLCLLTDSHCVVHLSRNRLWCSLSEPPEDHKTLMKQCEIHLCYLGNGIFVQLLPHEEPPHQSETPLDTDHTSNHGQSHC